MCYAAVVCKALLIWQVNLMMNPSPTSQAHRLYKEGKFQEALGLNLEALAQAQRQGNRSQERESVLYVGLCQYWLHRFDESESRICAALKIADEDGDLLQSLLIRNHLGATLRAKGDILAAYQLLEQALEQAASPALRVARMRLLGSFGALLDELGQRERADDCYSRYEELALLADDPDRLANAYGLAARSAELRDDMELAALKFQRERELAEQTGNKLRQLAAQLHHARMVANGPQKEQAAVLFEHATNAARSLGNPRRLAESLEAHARFLAASELGRALTMLEDARVLCQPERDYRERLANIDHQSALLCQSAGLHGESLFYLMRSVKRRYDLYEPLRDSAVRALAQRRLKGLAEFAEKLLDEACRVSRSQQEKELLLALHNQLHDSRRSWSELLEQQKTAQKAAEHPWEYVERVRSEAERRWKEVLLPGGFDKLSQATQDDLIQAQVSYTTAVNDLPRCVHLLATAIEREVGLRLFEPVSDEKKKPTLGSFKKFLIEPSISAGAGFRERMDRAGAGAASLRRILTQPIVALDRSQLSLVDLRNAVAHGNERTAYPHLSRLLVDAVHREVVLTPPSALQFLADQPEL